VAELSPRNKLLSITQPMGLRKNHERVNKSIFNVTDKQAKNNARVAPLRPYMFKKGQSGNPKGRPKTKTLKEYAREYLAKMTDEERNEYLNNLDRDLIWKMAEGNPKQELGGEMALKVEKIEETQAAVKKILNE